MTSPPPRRTWPDYRAVWRWHFYAGLFCIPVVLVLSVTGTIYLFKPQYEDWAERIEIGTSSPGAPRSPAHDVEIALAAHPDATFDGYELPTDEAAAGWVLLRESGRRLRVAVHPDSGEILATMSEDERLTTVVKRLHGELMLGDRGSHVVELTACWTLVMILTGVILWWPRNVKGLGGVLYPRLTSGGRTAWRDLHGVVGVWVSLLAVVLIVTGLPWANAWGNYFKTLRQWTGTASLRQDWSTGGAPRWASGRGGSGSSSNEHADHGGHGGRSKASVDPAFDPAAFDRVAAVAAGRDLARPAVISPPREGGGTWTVASMTGDRTRRETLTIDGATGRVVGVSGFADRHPIDKVVGVGIALHEGQLFGWPNQVLGVVATMGLITLAASGVVLWLRRRDRGGVGAPRPGVAPTWSWLVTAVVVAIGVLLPLFGLSLVVVLAAEWLVLRRVPGLREWLGLRTAIRPATVEPAA